MNAEQIKMTRDGLEAMRAKLDGDYVMLEEHGPAICESIERLTKVMLVQAGLSPRDGMLLLCLKQIAGEMAYREHLKRLPKGPRPTSPN